MPYIERNSLACLFFNMLLMISRLSLSIYLSVVNYSTWQENLTITTLKVTNKQMKAKSEFCAYLGRSKASDRTSISLSHNLFSGSQYGSSQGGASGWIQHLAEFRREGREGLWGSDGWVHGGEVCHKGCREEHLRPDQGDELTSINRESGLRRLQRHASKLGGVQGSKQRSEKKINGR